MSPETATAVAHRAALLENALRKVIRGKDDIIHLALVSMLARGHLLIEGVPGVGKTTLGQALARALDYIDANKTVFNRPDQFLAVSPSAYILWRQAGIRPLITAYSGFDKPENRKNLAYVDLTYPGSHNPLVPQIPSWLTDDEYRLVHQPRLPQLAAIFGRMASRSSQTWESAIYAKRNDME